MRNFGVRWFFWRFVPRHVTALMISLAVFAPAHARETDCPNDALAGVADLAKAQVEAITFSACKADPNNGDRMFVVIGYKPPGYKKYDDLPYVVGVYDLKSARTSSYFKSHLSVDATVWVDSAHVEIDTARYNLAENVRGFGVRINAKHFPRCAEGGAENELSLYVESGTRLRRLFGPVETNYFVIAEGPVCSDGPEDPVIHSWKLVLSLAASRTNGLRDLVLKFKGESGAKDVECVAKYNRVKYAGGCSPAW